MRREILVSDNVFYHNGYGPLASGQKYFWQTGGIYLYSSSLDDVTIKNNKLFENCGFQIGYSELFLRQNRSWRAVERQQHIRISDNRLYSSERQPAWIRSGGSPNDQVRVYAISGDYARFGKPKSIRGFLVRNSHCVGGASASRECVPNAQKLLGSLENRGEVGSGFREWGYEGRIERGLEKRKNRRQPRLRLLPSFEMAGMLACRR